VHPNGVTREDFSRLYPRLYHMADKDAWEPIRRRGLLSTTSILNLWNSAGEARRNIESSIRKCPVELVHPRLGRVVIRDQKPMYETKLKKALVDCTTQEWCRILNGRVFFWTSKERLLRHMSARENRPKDHVVLTIDSFRLVTAYERKITLCPMNSGNTIPFAQKRGKNSFMLMRDYPFRERLARGPYYSVVELAVSASVPDILDYTISVDYMCCKGNRLHWVSNVSRETQNQTATSPGFCGG
jgi:hypothetical protein